MRANLVGSMYTVYIHVWVYKCHDCVLLSVLQALNSRRAVTTIGIMALAKSGVYTAYLCSAGK